MVDHILSGRYRIVRHLARGGMAEVYLAHDQLLDRPVAVKVLFPELARDASFVERFRREAQSAARLNHPNIVSVYDFGEDADGYFIVMEYVAGSTLSDIIAAGGPMAPDEAVGLAADVAAALAAAHREGIVHRDVKPANVLIAGGEAKVADFGIARAIDARSGLTMPGVIIGTANYLSPEQAQGLAVDHRSDLYSLGMVLYEMLAGRPAFIGDNPVTIAYKQHHELPLPPSSQNPAVSSQLDGVVAKLLSIDPADRPDSADALRADLVALGGRPGTGEATTAFAPAATPMAPAPAGAGGATEVEAVGPVPPGAAAAAAAAAAPTGVTLAAPGGASGAGAPTAMAPAAGSGPGRDRPPPGPPDGTPRAVFRRRRIMALGLVVLVVLAAVVALIGFSRGGGPKTATVPAVVGIPVADAMARLTQAGLKPQVVPTNLAGVADQVVQQFPVAGVRVNRGTAVSLQVPTGTTTTSGPRVFTTRPTIRATTTAPPTTRPPPTTASVAVTTVPTTKPTVTITIPFSTTSHT